MLHTLFYYVVGAQLFANGGTSYRQDGQLVLVPKEWTVGLGKITRKCTKARNNDLSDTERTWKMNSQPLRFIGSATKKCSIKKEFHLVQKKETLQVQSFQELFFMLKVHAAWWCSIPDAGQWVFLLTQVCTQPNQEEETGGLLCSIYWSSRHLGLGGWSKVCPHCSSFLLQCNKVLQSDSKQHKLIILQFPWIRSIDTADLSPGLRVLPGLIHGVSWTVVSSEAQTAGRIQFLVVAGLRFQSCAGCHRVATQRS